MQKEPQLAKLVLTAIEGGPREKPTYPEMGTGQVEPAMDDAQKRAVSRPERIIGAKSALSSPLSFALAHHGGLHDRPRAAAMQPRPCIFERRKALRGLP